MKKKNILGVITARGGSKGIPGKNIKLLGEKPLIGYSIDAAAASALLTHCIVSTDDEVIADVARTCGGNVPFMRPKELAEDTTPHLPVMQHAIEFMEKLYGITYDYVAIFQPTSPFRTGEDIDITLQRLIDSDADSAVSLVESEIFPVKMKRIGDDGNIHPYVVGLEEPEGARRQDFPKAFKRSGDVYAMKREVIMERNRLYGDIIAAGAIVPANRAVDIDDPLDWIKAEHILERERKNGRYF